MVGFCLKLKLVAFRGQTHFGPEIFKMSYIRYYKTEFVKFVHHLSLIATIMESKKLAGQNPFSKWVIYMHFGNGIIYMNLTLRGIVKICPRLITKRH